MIASSNNGMCSNVQINGISQSQYVSPRLAHRGGVILLMSDSGREAPSYHANPYTTILCLPTRTAPTEEKEIPLPHTV